MSFWNLQVKSIKTPSGIYKSNLSRPLQESTKVYPSSRNQVINLLPVSSYPCLTSLCYFCCFQFFCCSGACLGGTVPCRVNKAPLTRIILLCSSFYGNSAPIFQETNCVSNCVIFLIPLPLGRPHSIFEGSPSVCCIFMCQSNDKAANTWDFLMSTQVLMNLIARGGCTNTFRESALKANSLQKVPCCIRESNLAQCHARPTLSQ